MTRYTGSTSGTTKLYNGEIVTWELLQMCDLHPGDVLVGTAYELPSHGGVANPYTYYAFNPYTYYALEIVSIGLDEIHYNVHSSWQAGLALQSGLVLQSFFMVKTPRAGEVKATVKDDRFPHHCPTCGKPSYNGLGAPEHQDGQSCSR